MYLIDIQRGIVDLALAGLEGGVRPTESPDIIQLAGGSRTGLHVEAIGVGLVAGFTILTGNCIFIDVILPQVGDKSSQISPLRARRFAVSSQLLKSPTTDTFCAWGAQTRKIHPRLFLLSAGCAPSQCHPSVKVPA